MAASVPPPDAPDAATTRRARRLVAIVFLAGVIGWVGFAAAQIIQQVMWPDAKTSAYPTCGAGLQALKASVDAGRAAAQTTEDPDRGLRAYRAAIDPVWRDLEGIRATCRSGPEKRGLDAVERLRYAEEQSVRREAGSLAITRQQTDAALEELGAPATSARPSPAPTTTPAP